MSGKAFGWENKATSTPLAAGILQLQNGVAMDTTLRKVADQANTVSPLQLSTTQVGVDASYTNTSGTVGGFASTQTFAAAAGSANFRPFNLAYTINNSGAQSGTATGIFLNATESMLNGMVHNLIDLGTGGGAYSSKFKVTNTGVASFASSIFSSGNLFMDGDVSAGAGSDIVITNRFRMRSPSDGIVTFINNAGTDFTRLQIGGTGPLFPSLVRNGTTIEFKLADGSAHSRTVASEFAEGTGYTSTFYKNVLQLYDGNVLKGYIGGSGFSMNTSLVVGSSTNTIAPSAILQADSTTKGFLPPRMTTAQKTAIGTPAAGLVVYDTTLNKLCVYTTAWETVTSI